MMVHKNGEPELDELEEEVEADVERERREHDLLDEEKMGMGELEEERMKPGRMPVEREERD
ncbi:hypothetical protein [Janthinobacterium sp. J1-1]|uniref:hypothetical protein n=1 Tax=Janthinobacterium sp. J1-1 TaxID=3065910 RepID=UPI0028116774|nr:hypothetical protein [Janthinobacterium sp. J1-1]